MTFRKICGTCIPLLHKYNAVGAHNTYHTRYSMGYVLRCLGAQMGRPEEVPDVIPVEISKIINSEDEDALFEKVIKCGDGPLYLFKSHYGCCQSQQAYYRKETQCLADDWIGARVSNSHSLIPSKRKNRYVSEEKMKSTKY